MLVSKCNSNCILAANLQNCIQAPPNHPAINLFLVLFCVFCSVRSSLRYEVCKSATFCFFTLACLQNITFIIIIVPFTGLTLFTIFNSFTSFALFTGSRLSEHTCVPRRPCSFSSSIVRHILITEAVAHIAFVEMPLSSSPPKGSLVPIKPRRQSSLFVDRISHEYRLQYAHRSGVTSKVQQKAPPKP